MIQKLFFLLTLFTVSNAVFAQSTCNTAQVITAGAYTIDTINGTGVPAPVCASGGDGATAGKWYKYTPTANYTVTVTTDLAVNPDIDNRVHIYTGNCGLLLCLTGDDDSGAGYLCVVTFQVIAGTEYKIAFDNRWTSNGFTFELQETPPIIINPNALTFTSQNIPTIAGTYKIAVADMNCDLLDDIVSVSSENVQIHYQLATGGFNPVNIATTPATFLPSWSMAIADYNKDGYGDLLYGGGSGVTFMRSANNGTEFTQASTSQYVFSQRSNFIDLNNDGNLDAFVCHDVAPNVYYLNDGLGNLQFYQGGMGIHPNGGNYGSIWVDYNNDGFSDLFIAKCRGGNTTAKINELHRNNGDGTFTDVSISSNMADPIQTWSAAWNDFDNDGFLDAIVGASSFTDGNHKFMHNNGDGTFSDTTAGSGWDVFPNTSIEYVSYDFNNDGWTDVFTNGKIMINNGNNTFSPVTYSINVGAVGDLNNDGFLDIQNGNTIYFSNPNSNNWTKLQLKGIESNSNGIGARVELYGAWGKQIRDVQSGIGFRHMGTMNVHFGIGSAEVIDSILVRWPSGRVDFICNPAINTPMILTEGSVQSPVASFTASATNLCEGTIVNFTDESTICPSAWTWSISPSNGWEFANSSSENSQNPEISFNEPGSYTVQLVASNTNDQSANLMNETIIVTATPTASISYSGSPFLTSLTTDQTVNQIGTIGGIYSSSTGLSIDANTGEITPSTSTAGTYTVTYTIAAEGGCEEIATSCSVTIVLSTIGITEFENGQVKIFPNPAESILNIVFDSSFKPTSIDLVSMLGSSVKRIYSNMNSIDISELQAGAYFIILTKEDGTKLTTRFVKK
jgi:PKD repeat protein